MKTIFWFEVGSFPEPFAATVLLFADQAFSAKYRKFENGAEHCIPVFKTPEKNSLPIQQESRVQLLRDPKQSRNTPKLAE